MNFFKRWQNLFLVTMTILLCYYPLCYGIDNFCIQLWDESRNVINSIEMLQNKHWFVRYFEGKPDMWELKPPFLIWLQALSFKIFGIHEWSARLPSMVFSMATVFLLLWMSLKISHSMVAGALAAIILVSSEGYVGPHVARSGDHDVVLTFFSTAMVFSAYLFFKTDQKKYLLLIFLSLFFGWLTKSIIIFMFLPGIFIWSLVQKKFLKVMVNLQFWIGLFLTLGVMLAYYLWRESQSPGYIHEVYMNEWFGRYFDMSDNYHYQHDSFWYYWNGFFNTRFYPFISGLLICLLLIMFIKKLAFRSFLIYLSLAFAFYFLVISAGSKNFWYDAPLYPIAAFILGLMIYNFYHFIQDKVDQKAILILSLCLIYPNYLQSYLIATEPDQREFYGIESVSYYLKYEDSKLPKNLIVLYEGTATPLNFYRIKRQRKDIKIKAFHELKLNDMVLHHPHYFKDSLNKKFETELVHKAKICEIRKLVALKN
jgi:4-amino-4-deoxy-L-arabinose transferase-like glycosyltransferase